MPTINQAVLIGASPQAVYNAITAQEGLSGWWTPAAKAQATRNSIACFPFGKGYSKEMAITALQPFELVQWNCIKGAAEWVGTHISFKLVPGSKESLATTYPEILGQIEQLPTTEGTLLLFQHADWKAATLMFAECSYTWGQFLRSLKLLCETGKGKPWPNQHRTEL